MATIRTLATAAAALSAALLLTALQLSAEPLAGVLSGTPIKLTPPKRSPQAARPEEPHKAAPATAQRETSTGRLASNPLNRHHVMRGPDSIDLIARLPWWRPIEMQDIHYPDKAFVSQALATADAWFVTEYGEPGIGSDESIRIAAQDELNELDLAADNDSPPHEPRPIKLIAAYLPAPSDQTWLQALLAMFGGALAAIFAARALFI